MKMDMIWLGHQKLWKLALLLVWHLLLIWLVGPGILLASPLQSWAIRQPWDAQERWETLRYFAGAGSLCYLPLLFWYGRFVVLWQQIPWLGAANLLSWRFRAFLGLFLIPLAPLMLEFLEPQTRSSLVRIRRPEDQVAAPPVPTTQAGLLPAEPEKRRIPGARVPRFLPPLHRPGGEVVVKRDPRPLGEVLLEEKQRREKLARSASPQTMSVPVPPEINWDEGEGTYREQ